MRQVCYLISLILLLASLSEAQVLIKAAKPQNQNSIEKAHTSRVKEIRPLKLRRFREIHRRQTSVKQQPIIVNNITIKPASNQINGQPIKQNTEPVRVGAPRSPYGPAQMRSHSEDVNGHKVTVVEVEPTTK